MAEAVGSAVVQEIVSRVVSFVLSIFEAAASKSFNIERLEMAHTDLELALERSEKLRITDVSLLRKRRMVKRAYEECGEALQRCKVRVLEDEEVEQGVIHSSLRKRIFHAVSSLVSLKKDELSCSHVARFERFADEARKFRGDVETGCSLAHYRFFSPLITHLLELKPLWYEQVQGGQTNRLSIAPIRSGERGVEALIWFISDDLRTPKEKISLGLVLRLSESTDVVGIITKCLKSLRPEFKPFAEVAVGELAQLTTQHVSHSVASTRLPDMFVSAIVKSATYFRPDPLCCRADGHGPCAAEQMGTTVTSEFPPEVAFMRFHCFIPADEYNLRSSAYGADGNPIAPHRYMELLAAIAPHRPRHGPQESVAVVKVGRRAERRSGSLRRLLETLRTGAPICHFNGALKTAVHALFCGSQPRGQASDPESSTNEVRVTDQRPVGVCSICDDDSFSS